ncbi:uncharacterized protein LOC129321232 [Prosopis cineraria]|uniref:uncharacterized protein LOC129321232 n=1 Tax=Prosopis cineraria TaxID=364024 RepID=UPI00240FA4C9|nr:uncharacterized protein LOC129321232 [Prosopis cineraria]
MEKDLTVHRSSYFSGGCMTLTVSPSSSSCFAVHDEFHYSRIHCCVDEHDTNNNQPSNHSKKGGGRWRNLLKRFMREGKITCGSKSLSFQYDPVSYSQNFDDGSHLHDPRPLPLLFHDLSSGPVLDQSESTGKHE